MHLGLIFGLSALASGLLLFPVRRMLLRFGALDRPNSRSSHSVPTVRGGGLAAVLLMALGIAAWAGRQGGGGPPWLLLLAFLGLALISLLDDFRRIHPAVRFGVQAAAVTLALEWLEAGAVRLHPLEAACAWLWIAGYLNAFNFMDGINGLAGAQVLVTGLGMTCVAAAAGVPWERPALVCSVALAGFGAGFLPHNFPKARVFMGDVGSTTFGFLLALCAFWIARDYGWWLLAPLVALHANFVLDTGITLVRRISRGETFYQSHREHFYQRLVRAGRSHARVTAWEMGLQIGAGVLLCLAVAHGKQAAVWGVSAVVAVWLLFFAVCEWAFRAYQLAEARAGRIGIVR